MAFLAIENDQNASENNNASSCKTSLNVLLAKEEPPSENHKNERDFRKGCDIRSLEEL